MKEIYVLGIGSSTPLFIEIAEAAGWKVAGLYHYNNERTGEYDHGYCIKGSFEDLYRLKIKGKHFLLTMGDMKIRRQISEKLTSFGGVVPTIVHPSAIISRFATIAEQGVIIGNQVELQNDVMINKNTVIRSGVLVCHNTTIGCDVFIGPKALVGAFLCIEDMVFIGQSSTLVSGKAVRIGNDTLIGAGALVTKPIPDNVIAVGNPAKVIKQR